MSRPRAVLPNRTYIVTRRVVRRHFLLRPDRDGTMQQLYWYFTAVVAAQLGIQVHCAQVLSNHLHEVLTDTRGNLPKFFELRNRLLANAVKCHRGWPEEVFSRTAMSCVELLTAGSIVNKIAYVIANCVAAFLVRSPKAWPGVKVLADDIGRRVVRVRRPDVYLDPNNPQWPETAEIAITLPHQLLRAHGNRDAACRTIQKVVDDKVQAARAAARREGREFQNAKRVTRVKVTSRAASWEEFGERFPLFSASGNAKAAAHWLAHRRQFLEAYRVSLERHKRGVNKVLFPPGTWKLSQLYGVRCAPTPA